MSNDKLHNRLVGVIVSLLFNGALVIILMAFVLPVVFPPPEPAGILIEFEDDEQPKPKPIVEVGGETPNRINTPGSEIEVAPLTAPLSNRTRAPRADDRPDARPATAGDQGDVERYEPPRQTADPASMFQSIGSGEAELDNKTRLKDNNMFPGTGTSDGEPTRGPNATDANFMRQQGVDFSLKGRSASGRWPLPEYKVQKAGRVVIEITVDRNGKVVRAEPRLQGSTINDKQLIDAAKAAALRATFNPDPKAANLQTGTITYVFKLK